MHALLTCYQILRIAITDAIEAGGGIDPDRGSFTIALNAAGDLLTQAANIIAGTVADLIGAIGRRFLVETSHGATSLPAPPDPAPTGQEAVDCGQRSVHHWHVSQLTRLGIPGPLAGVYADRIDCHQIARRVQPGCPPPLALRIAG